MTKKILIVDDDLESLKLVGLMLQRRGYEVVAAHSGGQALSKARIERPDLVILDVMMPGLDGYEVCQQLRADLDLAHLPVIMFTAKTLVGDKVAGFQAGADDYLTKPIHPNELVSHVEALLQRAEQERDETGAAPPAPTVGFIGAKGGVGTTTLVVNFAAALGEQEQADERDRRISIAEVHAGWGGVAWLLGQEPEGGWGALVHDAEAIDRYVVEHRSGLCYLPATPLPGDASQLPYGLVKKVLDHLTQSSDFLLLDLGSVLDDVTGQVLGRCDVAVVVVEPEPLCLAMAGTLIEKIKALNPPPADLRVVAVARVETELKDADIEARVGVPLTGVIPPNRALAHRAAKQGVPAVTLEPDSSFAKQIQALVSALL